MAKVLALSQAVMRKNAQNISAELQSVCNTA
jgi:hypothetical protein